MPNPKRRTERRYAQGRSGAALEAAKAHVYATETHCAATVCLHPTSRLVDKTRPYINPRTGKPDPWSKSFGHPDGRELDRPGTNPLDGHLEHLRCNLAAGAAYGNRKRAGTLSTGVDTSYNWSR